LEARSSFAAVLGQRFAVFSGDHDLRVDWRPFVAAARPMIGGAAHENFLPVWIKNGGFRRSRQ
jgi:hypothetical protein